MAIDWLKRGLYVSWKNIRIKLINVLLSCYSQCAGNLRNITSFDKEHDFERVVIFSTKRLGDFMFSTPAIRAVRRRYPAARIILVTSQQNSQLVEPGDNFNRVLPMDNHYSDMKKLVSVLRREKPQLAIILHSRAPYDIIASIMSGCEFIFKDYYRNEPAGMEKWLSGITRGQSKHIIQRKLDLVSLLGSKPDNTEMFIPARIPAFDKKPGKILIGLQMGASKMTHRWPVEHFAGLAKLLIETSPLFHLILIGSPAETEIAERFIARMEEAHRAQFTDITGKTTMPELLSVIDAMDLLVTNDTGPLHLAIAAKTKTISLFVLNSPDENGPYQNPELHKVIYKPPVENDPSRQLKHPMDRITVEEVYNAVVEKCLSEG
ncbi:glycosyltransferase family 9 protein [Rahnella perminowiae]|nr:glycosyltransferase family 9 protein [Rahnella perminowiae]